MEVANIQFAPLNIPFDRRLQTLAVGLSFSLMVCGGIIGFVVLFYLLMYTHHWPEALMYLFWIWKLDKETCDKGGRPIEWVRNWVFWRYVKEYFPTRLERVSWVELDPKRNYLFCCFPHGIFPMGAFTSFSTNAGGFREWFPHHKSYILTLRLNFLLPLLRDLAFAMGMCSASAGSLNWLLGDPKGGKAVALIVGGAEEAYHCRPGEYRLVLKKRKGFVKIALRNGAPLVPVFSFGETDVFTQVPNPKGSMVRKFQDWVKSFTGVPPIIPVGRGYLQYSFGFVPFRRPIYTIVGRPIEVEKIEYPTQEQIDSLHEKFVASLRQLFEEQKYNYLQNPSRATLVID